MIAAKKPDGNIRLSIDPYFLNLALKRSHYPLPVIEEILPERSKAKVFSKVHLKEVFLQAELDEVSSKLTAGGIAFTECHLESPQPRKFFR